MRTPAMQSSWSQQAEFFKTTTGVCQGCLLSSILFNLFPEKIMQETLHDHHTSISIGGRLICYALFHWRKTLCPSSVIVSPKFCHFVPQSRRTFISTWSFPQLPVSSCSMCQWWCCLLSLKKWLQQMFSMVDMLTSLASGQLPLLRRPRNIQ